MLGSSQRHLTRDDTALIRPNDANSGRLFNSLRTRASKTLPNFHLGLPSIASLRELTFGSPNRSSGDSTINDTPRVSSSGRASRLSQFDDWNAARRRSRSSPADPSQSLRRRAIQMKDSALLDLRTRANNFDLTLTRLPSFHFSLPFSDSSPPPQTREETIDNIRDFQHDADNISMTSLEVEALATDMKAENNRLRGIIEGLPKLGLPKSNSDEPYAGLSAETKDLPIVVLGGYRGSILRSAEDGRMLWVPVKLGLGIRKVDLELPLEDSAEEEASKSIRPDGMLTNIGPVDISRRLLNKLRNMQDREFCKVHEFGYDWRLGGAFLSDQLIEYLESFKSRVLVIAHSLGGLITLHALNRRPDLFRGVLFAGTPFHGCPNILGPFRYGDGVLLNKNVLTARTNFSMRSSFVLLPTHKRCFVDIESGKELPVDLFDAQAWKEYGLSPMVADDHGEGDVGESANVNGTLATGGVTGPSMGHGTADDTSDRSLQPPPSTANPTSRSPSPGRKATKTKAEDRDYREAASKYLESVLNSTLRFRDGLAYNPSIAYPPIALLRASSTPTVRGCSVHGYDGIREGDYSRFIFSSGDGVVTFASSDLATLSVDPDDADYGYKNHIVQDIENDRGHIGLLGDLAGVANCIEAILKTPADLVKHTVVPGTPTTPVLEPPLSSDAGM